MVSAYTPLITEVDRWDGPPAHRLAQAVQLGLTDRPAGILVTWISRIRASDYTDT